MATGAVSTVVEEVANNLEEAAVATRHINTAAVTSFLGGTGFGSLLGFFFGYRYSREKFREEAFQEARHEISEIRKYYRDNFDTSINADIAKKPKLEELVEEKGYAPKVVLSDTPALERLKSPVPIRDYRGEQAKRASGEPYVISHFDMINSVPAPGYEKVTYLYYEVDDMFADEDNDLVPNIEAVIGENNLKFGYGSEDEDVVYIRNDNLKQDIEVQRLHESYEASVSGLEPDESA